MEAPQQNAKAAPAPIQGRQLRIDWDSGRVTVEATCPTCGHDYALALEESESEAFCILSDCASFAPQSQARPLGWGDADEAPDEGFDE